MYVGRCVWVARLQQVDAAVVQQVGGALGGLLQQMVLVDDLHRLVVDAQPAIQPNVEDIRGVVTACCAVAVVIDNWWDEIPSGTSEKVWGFFVQNRGYNCQEFSVYTDKSGIPCEK